MSKGLTYDTKSQAEATAKDLRIMGHKARVRSLSKGQYRVYIEGEELTTTQKEEEAEIADEIRRHRIEKRVEELTKPTEAEEIKEETEQAARRLAVKKAMEKQPEEIERALLKQKQEQLKELIEERKRKGHADPGVIVPVFDPVTKQIID